MHIEFIQLSNLFFFFLFFLEFFYSSLNQTCRQCFCIYLLLQLLLGQKATSFSVESLLSVYSSWIKFVFCFFVLSFDCLLHECLPLKVKCNFDCIFSHQPFSYLLWLPKWVLHGVDKHCIRKLFVSLYRVLGSWNSNREGSYFFVL